jgi:8-oxo-dGTP diphosphatase
VRARTISYAGQSVILDPAIRVAYRGAHLLLRSYWFWRRPHTSGALVAAWHDGKILLVKNSYRKQYTLPGGYVRPGEDPRAAAARELREEVGMRLDKERLTHAYHGTKSFEFRHDTLDIYETELDAAPELDIDRREIVWAGLKTPAEARELGIVPHLEEYLEGR